MTTTYNHGNRNFTSSVLVLVCLFLYFGWCRHTHSGARTERPQDYNVVSNVWWSPDDTHILHIRGGVVNTNVQFGTHTQ